MVVLGISDIVRFGMEGNGCRCKGQEEEPREQEQGQTGEQTGHALNETLKRENRRDNRVAVLLVKHVCCCGDFEDEGHLDPNLVVRNVVR